MLEAVWKVKQGRSDFMQSLQHVPDGTRHRAVVVPNELWASPCW